MSTHQPEEYPKLVIRTFVRSTDYDQVEKIFIAGMHDMHEGIEKEVQQYVDDSLADDLKNLETVYLSRQQPPKGNFWVVTREGDSEILGMVGMEYKSDDECELRRMSVSPKSRRLQLGSFLLGHLLAEAKAEGYKKCVLSTLTRMIPGRKLYEKFGFKQTKTVEHSPVIHVVYYEKDII